MFSSNLASWPKQVLEALFQPRQYTHQPESLLDVAAGVLLWQDRRDRAQKLRKLADQLQGSEQDRDALFFLLLISPLAPKESCKPSDQQRVENVERRIGIRDTKLTTTVFSVLMGTVQPPLHWEGDHISAQCDDPLLRRLSPLLTALYYLQAASQAGTRLGSVFQGHLLAVSREIAGLLRHWSTGTVSELGLSVGISRILARRQTICRAAREVIRGDDLGVTSPLELREAALARSFICIAHPSLLQPQSWTEMMNAQMPGDCEPGLKALPSPAFDAFGLYRACLSLALALPHSFISRQRAASLLNMTGWALSLSPGDQPVAALRVIGSSLTSRPGLSDEEKADIAMREFKSRQQAVLSTSTLEADARRQAREEQQARLRREREAEIQRQKNRKEQVRELPPPEPASEDAERALALILSQKRLEHAKRVEFWRQERFKLTPQRTASIKILLEAEYEAVGRQVPPLEAGSPRAPRTHLTMAMAHVNTTIGRGHQWTPGDGIDRSPGAELLEPAEEPESPPSSVPPLIDNEPPRPLLEEPAVELEQPYTLPRIDTEEKESNAPALVLTDSTQLLLHAGNLLSSLLLADVLTCHGSLSETLRLLFTAPPDVPPPLIPLPVAAIITPSVVSSIRSVVAIPAPLQSALSSVCDACCRCRRQSPPRLPHYSSQLTHLAHVLLSLVSFFTAELATCHNSLQTWCSDRIRELRGAQSALDFVVAGGMSAASAAVEQAVKTLQRAVFSNDTAVMTTLGEFVSLVDGIVQDYLALSSALRVQELAATALTEGLDRDLGRAQLLARELATTLAGGTPDQALQLLLLTDDNR